MLRPQTCTLKAGEILDIPTGIPHALYCDLTTGLQFHEMVGDGAEAFTKRTTKFIVDTGKYHITAPSICGGSLEGKVVLVTGANRGLGLGFVRHLAERKAIVLAACRNPAVATEMNELLANAGPGSFAVKMDLNDLGSIQEAAQTAASQLGHVDIVINNAGVRSPTPRTAWFMTHPQVLTVNHPAGLEQESPE